MAASTARRIKKKNRLIEPRCNSIHEFHPRPDQLGRYDEQEGFVNSHDTGIAWHIGGNGAGTSEAAANKIARFVTSGQAPPRFDTPFWIIGETYEQVIGCIWKEKLFGHGHIPPYEVDWDRVTWYDSKQQLPMTVPLKPWLPEYGGEPGKNWVLEFKSYEQGFAKMQARSIGGFCFSEQFPWGILLEVMRGCREYNYPGAKFCEFTPVDPAKSIEIETLIEEDRLPKGWKVYRANTECAKEAGHVDAGWFEEFFGAVSDEMRDTRMTGRFPVYEGSIYPSFNPAIHATKKGERLIVPPGCHHYRGFDWGSGPEHPFVCLWMARDGAGRWYIYDEYYSPSQTLTYFDHLAEIERRWEWPQDKYHGVAYADPSRPDWIRVFSQRLAIMAGKNDVDAGIEAVRCAMKIDANGEPMLKIDRDACPNTMRQHRTYRWMKSTGKGANPADAQRKPLKKDDDTCDAARYVILSEQRASTGGPTGRFVQREIQKHMQYERSGRR